MTEPTTAVDEFYQYLAKELRDPTFRRLYRKAQRRYDNGHEDAPPIKPSLRRRGRRRHD